MEIVVFLLFRFGLICLFCFVLGVKFLQDGSEAKSHRLWTSRCLPVMCSLHLSCLLLECSSVGHGPNKESSNYP